MMRIFEIPNLTKLNLLIVESPDGNVGAFCFDFFFTPTKEGICLTKVILSLKGKRGIYR